MCYDWTEFEGIVETNFQRDGALLFIAICCCELSLITAVLLGMLDCCRVSFCIRPSCSVSEGFSFGDKRNVL